MSAARVEVISTNAVPARKRLNFWNDLSSATWGPMTIDSGDPDNFHAKFARLPLGTCELSSAWSSAAEVRWQAPATNSCSPDTLNFEFQYQGCGRVEHRGRESDLTPGDFVLLDPAQSYRIRFDNPMEALILRVPRALLLQRLGDVDEFLGVRIPGHEGPGALLSSFVLSAWSRVSSQFDPAWSDALSNIMLSLIEVTYARRPQMQATASAQTLARRQQAIELIDAHMQDPDFGVRELAEKIGVTPRYVQLLFAPLDVTPSVFILNRRLDFAARCFTHSNKPRRASEVAYSCGFNDLSYFCRAFKHRFGVSPRDYLAGRRRLV